MVRLIVTFSILFLIAACGGGDTGGNTDASSAPPVSAANSSAPKVPATPEPAAPATDPQKQSCLDLVGRAHFEKALPVCLAALRNSPADAELTTAVNKAKAETAKMAAAEGAAQAAAAGAMDSAEADAASKLGEAAKEVGE